jgi:lysophospholipase L1-like esterase
MALVMVGVNDVRYGLASDSWRHLQPTYEEILADGMLLVAMTATPIKGWEKTPWTDAKQVQLDDLNARIRTFCRLRQRCILIDTYREMVDPSTPHTLQSKYDYGDHLHLSQAGLDRIAELVRAAMP